MCGQKLPEDKVEVLRAEFDALKAKNLKEFEGRGNVLLNYSKGLKQAIEDKKKK